MIQEAPEGDKEVDGEAGEGGSTHVQSRPESIAPEDLGANEEVSEEALEGSPEPPRITNVKTEKGTAKWDNLYLPPAPPGYRPFLVLDGATVDGAKKSKSRASSRGDGSRPGTKSKSRMSVTPGDLVRPGDYVIAVHDVTMPPWQDKPLEPAYLLVKVKKKKKPPVGDQGKKKKPGWNTKDHIAQAMARSYSDMADDEAQHLV
ncbi:MORN repeat-containing protein 1 [Lingula anatina]|uniref:MORN repeat-containing protein 1 n=1 Tax=Lingula anatina TaxID=7574 RepID=A0A1S3I0Q7_LINAN|nr:MORN repeat-containing protein 1 [Lingula anatina]|eukprot:XP_013391843.1 MORN repeat-containing protein 1 [Lingula anatina]